MILVKGMRSASNRSTFGVATPNILSKQPKKPIKLFATGHGTAAATPWARTQQQKTPPLLQRITGLGEEIAELAAELAELATDLDVECETELRRFRRRQVNPFLQEMSWLREELTDLVTSSLARHEGKTALDKVLAPFRQDARQAHLDTLAQSSKAASMSRAEQEILRDLALASAIAGVAVVNSFLLVPALYWACVPGVIYYAKITYIQAYRALVDEHRISFDVLNSILITTALLNGMLIPAAIGIWSGVLLFWLITRTEDHSTESISKLFGEQPRFVYLVIHGVEVEVPFTQVQLGDLVVVYAGQTVPVDGVIVDGFASVDQHMLTGEAQPVEKGPGDTVFAITVVLAGRIYVQVEKAAQETVVAQIGQILTNTTAYKQALHSRTMAFVDRMGWPVLGLSLFAFPVWGLSSALGILWSTPGFRMVFFGPLSMLSFLYLAAQKHLLVKDGRSLELLNDVDTVIFDKTGTLTLEEPVVYQIHCCPGQSKEQLLCYTAAAELKQTHPIARAILHAAREQNLSLPEVSDVDYQIGYGIQVKLHEHTLKVGSERFMALEGIAIPSAFGALQDECYRQGHSLVWVAMDDQLAGAIELRPTVRPEAQYIVQSLRERGLALAILSGDHEAPTRHLAAELGIDHYFAQVLPGEKSALIERLQQQGHTVCFVGDGINDAIALKKANVSVSFRGATTVAMDTAQIVLMDSNLSQLAHLFELADRFNANMRVNFLAAVLPGTVCIAGSLLFGWGFLTAVLVSQVSTPFVLYHIAQPLLAAPNPEFTATL